MKYIEIDGERIEVHGCDDCPCYDGGDDGYCAVCKHPSTSETWRGFTGTVCRSGTFIEDVVCPLREVEE